MSDLEANKSIVLRLAEAFNDRQLDLLEDVLHPEFRGRGISAFPPIFIAVDRRWGRLTAILGFSVIRAALDPA